MAEDFALRAGAAVENARLYRAASEIARALQTSLLPPRPARHPGGGSWPPPTTRRGHGLEVGGDFYDVFSPARASGTSCIGDVCGKGAEAAAVTALTRYTICARPPRGERSPAAILRWVGRGDAHAGRAGGRFCTVACVHVDVTAARRAGHGGVRRASAGGRAPRGRTGRSCSAPPGTLLGLLGDLELPRPRPSCGPATRSCSTPTGSPRRARRCTRGATTSSWRRSAAAPTNGPVGLVDSLVAERAGRPRAPRDDLAVLVAASSLRRGGLTLAGVAGCRWPCRRRCQGFRA